MSFPLTMTCAAALCFAAPPSLPSAISPPDDVTYEQGAAAYGDEDYERAAEIFGALAERDPSAEHFFALGQANRLAGNCDEARRAYLRYLSTGVGAEQVDAIDELMSDCEAPSEQAHYAGLVEVDFRLRDPADPEGPAPGGADLDVDEPSRPKPGTGMFATGLTLTALGGAATLAGVITYTWGINVIADVEQRSTDRGCTSDSTDSECRSLAERRADAVVGRTAGGWTALVAPGVLATGIVLTVIGRGKRRRALVSGMYAPGGGGVMVSGRF